MAKKQLVALTNTLTCQHLAYQMTLHYWNSQTTSLNSLLKKLIRKTIATTVYLKNHLLALAHCKLLPHTPQQGIRECNWINNIRLSTPNRNLNFHKSWQQFKTLPDLINKGSYPSPWQTSSNPNIRSHKLLGAKLLAKCKYLNRK